MACELMREWLPSTVPLFVRSGLANVPSCVGDVERLGNAVDEIGRRQEDVLILS